jgi:hypothetical protein
MFQTQPGQERSASAPGFLTLIVFALSLAGLLVALEMATQYGTVTVSHQQAAGSVKTVSAK